MTKWMGAAILMAAGGLLSAPARAQGGGPGEDQGRSRQGSSAGRPIRQREHQRIHASDQDRVRAGECTGTARRLREHVREMDRDARRSGFGKAQAHTYRDRIRREFESFERQHRGFIDGLTDEQRSRIHDWSREMDQTRDRVRERLRQMDHDCDQDPPDRVRLREHARDLEREMDRLRRGYRDLQIE